MANRKADNLKKETHYSKWRDHYTASKVLHEITIRSSHATIKELQNRNFPIKCVPKKIIAPSNQITLSITTQQLHFLSHFSITSFQLNHNPSRRCQLLV